jgi:hypothetical protein
MKTRRNLLSSSLFASGIIALGGCGRNRVSLRYRLTVEVDTPEGLKSGFSVIEIYGSENPNWVNPEGRGSRGSHKGEAVYVELPNGQNLFALLRTRELQPDATEYPLYAFEDKFLVPTKNWSESIETMKSWRGQVAEMTSTITFLGSEKTVRVLPGFASFADINNPSSVRKVLPFDFAAVFGAGYNLRRVTVTVTDEPITRRILTMLPWLKGLDAGGPVCPRPAGMNNMQWNESGIYCPNKDDLIEGFKV